MPAFPNPPRRDMMKPAFFNQIKSLAESEEALALLLESPAEDLVAAARAFIAAAQKSGLPPEHWRLSRPGLAGQDRFCAPLFAFYIRSATGASSGRAGAAEAADLLFKAGCSLWHSEWSPTRVGGGPLDHTFIEPRILSRFVLSDSAKGKPLRQAFLRIALADPRTPSLFLRSLRSDYDDAVDGASLTAQGVLGPRDRAAKIASAILSSCSSELIAASSRPEWADAAALASDAAALFALKSSAPNIKSPAELKKSATAQQKTRLKAIGSLIQNFPEDEDFILSGLEGAPWLKSNPNLACVCLSRQGPSLLAIALAQAHGPTLHWLDQAGANPWLASAQSGSSDACYWAMDQLEAFKPDADLSPIARMLLRGAWLDGAPDPKARCLTLANEAIAALIRRHGLKPSRENASVLHLARSLVAHMEKIAIEEVMAPASGSSAAKPAARSL